MTTRAIDPAACGCTDCLIGYSVPLDLASPDQVWRARLGFLQDRTGGLPELTDAEVLAIAAVRGEIR